MGVERLDARVRKAFKEMCDDHNLYSKGQEVLDATSSDIAFPVSEFPSSKRVRGKWWFFGDGIPKAVRGTEGVAFRAELRRGDRKNKDRYIAIMWESYGEKGSEYQLTYYTNYPPFLDRRESQPYKG